MHDYLGRRGEEAVMVHVKALFQQFNYLQRLEKTTEKIGPFLRL
jgi:hypothetical protein